tara:strand:- start:92 stop:298 length:207 start_codon:yes stop_codon:yes gene_type:complete
MNNPSSFSSISFETESAIKFKELAKEKDMTHTELLNELMTPDALEILQNEDRIKWASEALARDSKNES